MEKRIAVIGGDKRFAHLAQFMAQDGYEVMTCGLQRFFTPKEKNLFEALEAERIVLPMPLAREEGYLNSMELRLPLEELWERLCPRQAVFAGSVRGEDRAAAERQHIRLRDYYACEELAIYNAVPTAEGAIEYAMRASEITIHGAPCLVVGYGRIGKILAQRLRALGAEVWVSARKQTDRAWIEAFGYKALDTMHLAGALGGFRFVFNTVPAEVLDEAQLSLLRRDCILVELASRTGFDVAAAQRMGLNLVAAAALPGKCAPETAAKAIRAALYQMWEEEE